MSSKSRKLDIPTLAEIFAYDCETGVISYKLRRGSAKVGDVAGSLGRSGYRAIPVNRRSMLAHRVAWALHYNEQPPEFVDHINGDRADNRIENLRPATRMQNQGNRKISANNTTGFKGVTYHKRIEAYAAQIRSNGKLHHLGLFDCPEAAHQAYLAAAKSKFGEYARAG